MPQESDKVSTAVTLRTARGVGGAACLLYSIIPSDGSGFRLPVCYVGLNTAGIVATTNVEQDDALYECLEGAVTISGGSLFARAVGDGFVHLMTEDNRVTGDFAQMVFAVAAMKLQNT